MRARPKDRRVVKRWKRVLRTAARTTNLIQCLRTSRELQRRTSEIKRTRLNWSQDKGYTSGCGDIS